MMRLQRIGEAAFSVGLVIIGAAFGWSVVTDPEASPATMAIGVGFFLMMAGAGTSIFLDGLVGDGVDDADEPSAKPDLDADVEENSNEVAA